MNRITRLFLGIIILQSCKPLEFANGIYRYEHNNNVFFNTSITLRKDHSFSFESGGDMIIWKGNGTYKKRGIKYIELYFSSPIVRTTLTSEPKSTLKYSNGLVSEIKNDTLHKVNYDTIQEPIGLEIRRRNYYFVDKRSELIKNRTSIYTKHRRFFLGSHYRNKRNKLIFLH